MPLMKCSSFAAGLFVVVFFVGVGVGCADLPGVVDVPDVVVGERGNGDGGRLLSMQLFVDAGDYATRDRFDARVRALFDEGVERGLVDDTTVVVLPEYSGTWLVTEGEGSDVFTAPKLSDAITSLATAHLGSFLLTSFTAPVDDGDAFAAFTEKSARMAAVYDDVMGGVAHDYGVTLVAGSIILPDAFIASGRLQVRPGAPLQNVSVVYDASGDAISIARKHFPTKDEQGFVDATDDVAVVDTPIGRLGVLVCADAWFPESYDRLVEKGAELLAVPTFHSGNDIWNDPWGGYSGHGAPDDVDTDDIGALTEATAWDKYALAGRAKDAGIRGAVSAPLRGQLWDLGDDGQAFLVDGDGFDRMENADAPGLFSLTLPQVQP